MKWPNLDLATAIFHRNPDYLDILFGCLGLRMATSNPPKVIGCSQVRLVFTVLQLHTLTDKNVSDIYTILKRSKYTSYNSSHTYIPIADKWAVFANL